MLSLVIVLNLHLSTTINVDFNSLGIPSAEEFVQEYIIDKTTPEFIAFITALASISALRAFGRW